MSVTTRKYVPPCEVHKTLWNFRKIEDTLRGAKKRGWQNVCQCNSMTPNFEFRSAGAGTLDRAEFVKWINVRNPLSKSTKRLAFSQKKRQKTIWSCYEKDTQRISLSTILSAEQELKRGWLPFESDTYANVKISLSAILMAEQEAKRGRLLFVRYVSVASFGEGYAKISSFPLSFPQGWARSKTWPTHSSRIRKIPLRNVGSEQETRSVAFLLYKRTQESLPESLSGQEKETRLTLYLGIRYVDVAFFFWKDT